MTGRLKRLIDHTSKKPNSSDISLNSAINKDFWGPLLRSSLIVSITLISSGFFPISAHAGLFSFVSDLFVKPVVTEEKEINSQNAPILQAALHVDPNPAKGGGDITVVAGSALLPDSGPSGTIADIEEQSVSSDQISLYVVREGDTLSQIAKMFGVTVSTIAWANDIKGGLIAPGDTLVILPISGVKHKIVKGDTIKSLAKKYGADEAEILSFNALDEGSKLSIGEEIIIPDGEIKTTQPSTTRIAGGGGPALDGYYIRPISGGRRSQGIHGYNGIDIAAPVGTPIFAAAAGEVIISREGGWNGGYGSYVVIKHPNGTQTLYAHNSRNVVKQGWQVVQGQIIGYVGNTGKSTGPHVHFEIRGAKNPF